jgi:membrane-bound ClpP family serine protease
MEIWVFAILLLAVGFSLKLLAFFFPSGGLFVLFAVAAWGVAVLLAFRDSPRFGLGMLTVVVIGVPIGFALMIRFWPQTRMGRRVLLVAPSTAEVLPDDSSKRLLKSLVGRVGRATCKMLPSGVIEIDGRMFEAASVGIFVEEGQAVRVVKVEGSRLIVRPDTAPPIDERAENPLDRPIGSIGDDPFEDDPFR